MAVMVFPPYGVWWVGLLAWFPLMWALQGATARVGFRLGLLWGLLTYGATLSWLWTVFGPPAVGLWLILGVFVGFFGLAYGQLTRVKRAALWPGLLAAVLWVGIEYFRGEWFWLRFPWITAGTGLPPNALTPVIGVYGVSFVVILGSAWMVTPGVLAKVLGVGTLFGLGSFILGPQLFQQYVGSPVSNEGFRVALVQGELGYVDAYLDQTNAVAEIVDAVVWPEHAVNRDIRTEAAEMEQLKGLIGVRTKMLTLGSRTMIDEMKWYNTAITIGTEGVLGTHHKNRPVHFFEDGEPGTERVPFETPVGVIGTPICFDCDYTEVIREYAANGAEVFLVPSMDPEPWTAKQHEQHGMLFRHRAAETHRWFAVASSSGVTQIIDPAGLVVDRLPLMDEGVLVGTVSLSQRETIYVRWGWLLGPICVWLAAGLLLWVAVVHGRAWLGGRRQAGGDDEELNPTQLPPDSDPNQARRIKSRLISRRR